MQPKLSKLTDSEDIEAFLKTFERVMEAYQVDQSLWAFQLAPQLTGKAQLAYAALCREDAAKYDEVMAAILRRYDINAESYRTRFRGAKRKDGESYREVAVRLQDLLKKWMEGCVTVDEVFEKILIEQLLNIMPLDLRIWVSEHKPESVAQASDLAENYVQAQKIFPTHRLSTGDQREGLGKETRKCHSCHKEGHLARDCPEIETHSTAPGKEMPSGTDKVKKPLKCFNCNQVLLRANPHTVHSEGSDQALVVTKTQVRRNEEEVCLRQASEQASDEQTNSISDVSSGGGAGDLGEESDKTTTSDVDSPSDDDVMTEESVEQQLQCEILGHEFTDDFVPQVSDLEKLTRSQKRRMRRKRGLTRAKERPASKWQDPDPELSVSQAALRQLQETDQ